MKILTVPFLFAQSELFLLFFPNVVSGCTEIIILFNQEILHFKIINEQFSTSLAYI